MNTVSNDQIRQNVRNRYRQIALQDISAAAGCCSQGAGCGSTPADHDGVSEKLAIRLLNCLRFRRAPI